MEQINRFSIKTKSDTDRFHSTVIICGAGSLFRMKTFGPKGLFPHKNGTLLDEQIRCAKAVNHSADIIVTVGHMADKVYRQNYQVRYIENQLYENTGIAEEIRLALNAVTSQHVIIVDGDICFDIHAMKALVYSGESALFETASGMPDEEPGIVSNKDGVSNLAYDINPKWGQMCVLSNNELRIAKKVLGSRDKSHLIFHEIINIIISKGGKFKTVRCKDSLVSKINSPKLLKTCAY